MDNFIFNVLESVFFERLASIMILVVLIVSIVGFFSIPYLIYEDYQNKNKPTFELKKDDWECKRARSFEQMVLVGKTMAPEIRTECILWGKK
jgi:hypothetical protein